MDVTKKIVTSNLKKNKKRTLSTIISIILTCTLLFSISIAYSTIVNYNVKNTTASHGSYHVKFEGIDYSAGNHEFSNDKDIANYFILQETDQIFIEEMAYEKNVHLKIMSYDGDYQEHIKLINGSYPQNGRDLIISSRLSQELALKIGDLFEEYRISGIFEESTLGDDYTNMAYRPLAYTKNKIDTTNTKSAFFVTYKNVRESYSKIKENADHLNVVYYEQSIFPSEHVSPNSALLNAYGLTPNSKIQLKKQIYLSIMLFVVSSFCALIIYNSFSISLTERQKQFGILRSLGASKRQIIGFVAQEILILSLISIPIAFILSVGLIQVGLYIVNDLLNTSITLHIGLSFIITGILFIIFMIIISAITPARKASHISPIEAIRNQKEFHIKKSKEHYPIIKRIFGIPGEVAYKNIKRNSKKFTATVITLTISILLFISVSTLLKHMILSADEDLGNSTDVEIWLQIEDKDEVAKFLSELKSVKEIDDILITQNWYLHISPDSQTAAYKNSGRSGINILGFDDESLKSFKKEIGYTGNEPLFYNLYKEHNIYQKAVLDDTKLEICINYDSECFHPFDDLQPTEKNYLNYFDKPSVIMSLDEFAKLLDDMLNLSTEQGLNHLKSSIDFTKKNMYIMINAKKYRALDTHIKEILNKHTNMTIQYENYTLLLNDNDRTYMTIKFILYSILIFIAIISTTGILNSINTNINLRQIEFSVLRSIGFSHKDLRKMIRLENVFLLSKTILYSLPSSAFVILLLSWTSNIQTSPGYTPTPIPFPWDYMAISILFVAFLIIVVTRMSIKKIEKANIVDAIRKNSI